MSITAFGEFCEFLVNPKWVVGTSKLASAVTSKGGLVGIIA